MGLVPAGQLQLDVNEYDAPFCGVGFPVIGTGVGWPPGGVAGIAADPCHKGQFETVCGAPVELINGT